MVKCGRATLTLSSRCTELEDTSPTATYDAMVRALYDPRGQRWQAEGSDEDALVARYALYSMLAAVVLARTLEALVELLPFISHSEQVALRVAPRATPDEPRGQLVQLARLVAPTIDDQEPGGQERHVGTVDDLDDAKKDELVEDALAA